MAVVEKLPFCITSIMRNEIELLPRYFESIEKHLGKIGVNVDVIIVDTGSTDNSVEYSRSRGALVYEEGDRFSSHYNRKDSRRVNELIGDEAIKTGDRLFDFAAARNCSNEHATTEWCLSLDICDLIITFHKDKVVKQLETLTRINKELVEKNNKKDITWGLTYTLLYGPLTVMNPTVQSASKLYQRTLPDGKWRCMVHEVFSAAGTARKIAKGEGDEDALIVRHAQRPSVSHNYLPGLAYAYLIKNEGSDADRARLLYYFSRELYYRKYHGNVTGSTGAKKYLTKVCGSTLNWIKERSGAACHLAECYSAKEPEYINKKRKAYILAVNLYPGWREPYLKLSGVCYEQEDWAGMIGYGKTALEISKPNDVLFAENPLNYTTEPNRLLMLGYARLAKSMMESGAVDARSTIDKALELEPVSGCGENVFYFNWQVAYTVYYRYDQTKAKVYYDKCYKYNKEGCEKDYKWFYPK